MNYLILKYFLIALIISLIWCIIGRKQYSYNKKFPIIFGINTFPLISWTLGLTAVMLLYNYIESLLGLPTIYSQFGVFVLLYWIILLFVETVGYHFFKISNTKAAKYKPIPILNCMRASWWMKIVYFSLGPIMFILCKILIG